MTRRLSGKGVHVKTCQRIPEEALVVAHADLGRRDESPRLAALALPRSVLKRGIGIGPLQQQRKPSGRGRAEGVGSGEDPNRVDLAAPTKFTRPRAQVRFLRLFGSTIGGVAGVLLQPFLQLRGMRAPIQFRLHHAVGEELERRNAPHRPLRSSFCCFARYRPRP